MIDMPGEWPSLRPSSVGVFVSLVRASPTRSAKWNVVRRGPIGRVRWRVMWGLSLLVPPSRRAATLLAHPNGEVARYLNASILANWRLVSILRAPPTTAIPVTVFVTRASAQLYQSPELWWTPLVGRGISVMMISGTHATVFDPGHLDSLVTAIECSLPATHRASEATTGIPLERPEGTRGSSI